MTYIESSDTMLSDKTNKEKNDQYESLTVVGGKGTKEVLLVLTERKTKQEIVRKMKVKSQYCLVKELDN